MNMHFNFSPKTCMSENERNKIFIHYEFSHHTKLIASTDTQLKNRSSRMNCLYPFLLDPRGRHQEKYSCLKAEVFIKMQVQ